MKRVTDPAQVIRLYKKGFSLQVIQTLVGTPTAESSKIVKEAGIFNYNKQRDYFNEQSKNKRVN